MLTDYKLAHAGLVNTDLRHRLPVTLLRLRAAVGGLVTFPGL